MEPGEEFVTSGIPDFKATRLVYKYPVDGVVEYAFSSSVDTLTQFREHNFEFEVESFYSYEGSVRYLTSPGPESETTSIIIGRERYLVEARELLDGSKPSAHPDAEPPAASSRSRGTPDPDEPVVVDERGNVLEAPVMSVNALYNSGFYVAPSYPRIRSGVFDRPFGPTFPDYPVTVGDSWTEVIINEEVGGPIEIDAIHELVDVEVVFGREILVVISTYVVEGFEWDFSDYHPGFIEAILSDQPDVVGARETLPGYRLVYVGSQAAVSAVTHCDPEAGLVIRGELYEFGSLFYDETAPVDNWLLFLTLYEDKENRHRFEFPFGKELGLTSNNHFRREVFYSLVNPNGDLFVSCDSAAECRRLGLAGPETLMILLLPGGDSEGLRFQIRELPRSTAREGMANTDLRIWYEDEPDVVWSPEGDPWQFWLEDGRSFGFGVDMPSRPEYLYVQWKRPDGKTLLWKTITMVRDRLFTNPDWVWESTNSTTAEFEAVRVADRICWAHWTGIGDPHRLYPDPLDLYGGEPVNITTNMIDWVTTEVCP